MTLAARCPACNTVFRVVQDQLRVSEGWVRCGRCAEVFNAIDTLLEIETDLPPKAPALRGPGTERVLSELARVRADETTRMAPAWPPPAPSAPPMGAPAAPTMASTRSAGLTEPPAPERFQQLARAPAAASPATPAAVDEPAPVVALDPGPAIESGERPAFVKRAEEAERWRRPAVRAALAIAACGAAVTLMGQSLVEYRDQAAARWPTLQPALVLVCEALACSVGPPHAIDALVVDSSGLVRIEGTSMYRLSVALRNRATWAVAAPAIDLTLTDAQGSVIARRVVRLSDFGSTTSHVPPATNLVLQAAMGGLERTVSGYTIEVFYP